MGWFDRKRRTQPPPDERQAEAVPTPSAPPAVPPPQTPPVPPVAPAPEWNLKVLTAAVVDAALDWDSQPVDAALIEARLADCYRDGEREPLRTRDFAKLVEGLDESAWRRLAVAVWTLNEPELRTALAVLSAPVEQQVAKGFVELARATDALTLELIYGSGIRAEEFGRHFAAHLSVRIAGETHGVSARRREQLDYRRLLAAAQQAKLSAEEQVAYLRELQAQQDAGRRRGKW